MSLSRSPFQGSVCHSNSGTRKLVLNQTIPTFHPLSSPTTYLFFLMALSPCTGTMPSFPLFPFMAKSDHSRGTHSNLTFSGSLLGSAYNCVSHSPALPSRHALFSIRVLLCLSYLSYCTRNFPRKQTQSGTCEHIP